MKKVTVSMVMRPMLPAVLVLMAGGCARPGVGSGATPVDGRSGPAIRPHPSTVVPPGDYTAALEAGTRSPSGEPGPAYWQQWADYVIETSLDPAAKRLDGRVAITYHNSSPRTLSVVFLHLLQNLHAPGVVRNRPVELTGGVDLTRVVADGQVLESGGEHTLRRGPGYRANGTILAIRPPRPLRSGGTLELDIEWGFTIPQSGVGRMGWSRDDLFFIAYWYPQMAVYDDVVGWHLDPYLGSAEFYTGFGNYDLTIEAPDGWVIMATGALENRREVLPAPVLERLERAEASDEVVSILTEADVGPGRATQASATGRLRWRFLADSVRDVAWSATRQSRWDAARAPVGDRDGDGVADFTRVDAIWRVTAPRWQHSVRYSQHAIDFLSRYTGIPYPWPHMTAVEGGGIIGGGMEFPMMTLIGDYNTRGDEALYNVTAHEEAHMWIPMIVGIDEKRYGWMDEGSTSFNENQARKEFFPESDPEARDLRTYLDRARRRIEGEMMRWTDFHYPGGASGVASYSKPATALTTLRRILGPERFDRAWQAYIRAWAYKHPKPWDFFAMMETQTGEELDWFWQGWYYETWTLDHAVGQVETGSGTTVTIENRGRLPMPTRVIITLDDGSVLERVVPVRHWLNGYVSASIAVPPGRGTVIKVEIDPDGVSPDIDRANNVWKRGAREGGGAARP